jgi:multidrug efflux pump subunit AcrA (membrane-fusion protein)
MFIADAIDKVEIPVQVSMNQLSMLINPSGAEKEEKGKKDRKRSPFNITVQVNGGTKKYSWKGEFLRIASGVDTSTRMLNMIVGVPNPYHRDTKNLKPPLEIGLFCSVKIKGKTVKNLLVLPRYAIHDGNVYIADKDSRLEIRPVKTGFNIDQYTIIESGLKPGEKVIVSDIVPTVKGMRLKLKIDNNFIKTARRELSGSEAKHD